MVYADELLELAQDIANLHPQQSHQSSLRRAVSTAYYALFHLLISEATVNWGRPELRGVLLERHTRRTGRTSLPCLDAPKQGSPAE
jgi:hypothetical protein